MANTGFAGPDPVLFSERSASTSVRIAHRVCYRRQWRRPGASLSQAANARLEREHPYCGGTHKFMIRVITRRLQLTATTLQAVLT